MQALRPIRASEFVTFNEVAKSALLRYGGVAVNDVFLPLWEQNPKIWILRGGRGGGKSEAVADRLIEDCRTEKYFKCYYGRKVFETVRHSCFETLYTSIEKLGKQKEFSYSKANSSSMIITHLETGGQFVPFGSDKPEKLKSIKDPTVIWCEEFPEFTFEDFKELLPTLRTARGKNQFIGTLNAYSIFTDDWRVKLFFPDQYTGKDLSFELPAGITLGTIFANYYDNFFIDRQAYEEQLRLSSAGNSFIYEGLANGAWGVIENNNPWLYAFDEKKHVRPSLPFLPTFPVYIFMDINNEPLECTLWQMSPVKGTKDSFIHCIKEYSGNFKLEELAARIKSDFPASILYLGGDRSGQNEDVGRNQTIYQIMAGLLGLNNRQLLLNTHNLEHADSRLLCNAMLANYPKVLISKEGAPNLIRQCQLAKVDVDSNRPGQLLKDRGMYKLDAFDSMRYMYQTLFNEFAKEVYFRAKVKR